MLFSAGQMNDRKGARLILGSLPPARSLITDLISDCLLVVRPEVAQDGARRTRCAEVQVT